MIWLLRLIRKLQIQAYSLGSIYSFFPTTYMNHGETQYAETRSRNAHKVAERWQMLLTNIKILDCSPSAYVYDPLKWCCTCCAVIRLFACFLPMFFVVNNVEFLTLRLTEDLCSGVG